MDEERVGWVDSPTFYDHHIRTIKVRIHIFSKLLAVICILFVFIGVVRLNLMCWRWEEPTLAGLSSTMLILSMILQFPFLTCYNGKKELFFCFLFQISMKMEVEERNVHPSCCILLVRSSLIISRTRPSNLSS
ncbi:hypothetical protein GBA52_007628 [Prunus armeniaca]|nr:hypothetical protein GBA52_007628 [Prunus armeniaca]